MHGQWIVDDEGATHRSGSQDVAARLGMAAALAEDHAILNKGWIGLGLRHETWHVRYRPSIVSERAIVTLFYSLLDSEKRPVAISWYDQLWTIDRTPDPRTAVSSLSHMLELRGNPTAAPGPRIRSRQSTIAKVRWRSSRATVSDYIAMHGFDDGFRVLLDREFAGRWFLNDVSPSNGRVTFVDRGNGFPPFDRVFTSKVEGGGLEQIGDADYRDWVIASLADVAARGKPRFDDVDAIVTWPKLGDMRTRYWRFMVPIADLGDTTRVLAVSANDSTIDLRPGYSETPSGGATKAVPRQATAS